MSQRLEQLLDELEDEVNQLAGQLGEKTKSTSLQLKTMRTAIDSLVKSNVDVPGDLQAAYDRLESELANDHVISIANNTINRLDAVAHLLKQKTHKTNSFDPSGPTTPTMVLRAAAIDILNENNGCIEHSQMIKQIEERVALTESDWDKVSGGHTRWKKRFKNIKSRGRESGVFDPDAPRSHWKINGTKN